MRSFVGTPQAKQAVFVRVHALSLGGEFDIAADEEVGVDAEVGGRKLRLVAKVLDLPARTLKRFEVDGDWVELEPTDPLRFGLRVVDEDLTGSERITNTTEPVQVAAQELGPEPKPIEVPLATIRLGDAKRLGSRQIVIEGPSAELSLIALPRRDEADDDYRATLRPLFAEVLSARAPETPADARSLARSLADLPKDADAAARRSTHTRLRRVAPKLAAQAESVRQRALDVGALASVAEALPTLAESAAPHGDDAHFGELAQRLAALGARTPPVGPDDLAALDADVLELGVAIDLLPSRPRWLEDANRALSRLLRNTRLAKRGLTQRAELSRRLSALQQELRAELGESE